MRPLGGGGVRFVPRAGASFVILGITRAESRAFGHTSPDWGLLR